MENKLLFFAGLMIFALAVPALAKQDANFDFDGTLLPPGLAYRVFVHHPHPEPKPLSPVVTCTETQDDQVTSYGSVGWHLPGSRSYRMNEATVPGSVSVASAYSAMDASWTTWQAADGAITVSRGLRTSIKRARRDGVNLVAWGQVPGNALAVTYTWYNTLTGENVESDTVFNSRVKWSRTPSGSDCGGVEGTYDVGDIAVHEFGHWVGLDDLYDPSAQDLTMYGYGFTSELKKNSLGLGDIIGAAAVTP